MHQSRARKSQKTSRWKKKEGTCTPYHGSGATRGVLGYTFQHLAWANRPARQTGAYPTELVWVWVMLCYGEGDAAYRNFTWRLFSSSRVLRSPSPFRSSENPTLHLSSLATFRFLLKRKGRCKRLTRREMERRKKKVSLNLFTFSVILHNKGVKLLCLFLPHFDIICDLLLSRPRATWNLFVW